MNPDDRERKIETGRQKLRIYRKKHKRKQKEAYLQCLSSRQPPDGASTIYPLVQDERNSSLVEYVMLPQLPCYTPVSSNEIEGNISSFHHEDHENYKSLSYMPSGGYEKPESALVNKTGTLHSKEMNEESENDTLGIKSCVEFNNAKGLTEFNILDSVMETGTTLSNHYVRSLINERDELKNTVENLKQQAFCIEDLKQQLNIALADKASLKCEIAALNQEVAQEKNKQKQMQTELKVLSDSRTNLLVELDNLRLEVAAIKNFKSELYTLQDAKNKLELKVENLQKEQKAKELNCNNLKETIHELENENENLVTQVKILSEAVSEIPINNCFTDSSEKEKTNLACENSILECEWTKLQDEVIFNSSHEVLINENKNLLIAKNKFQIIEEELIQANKKLIHYERVMRHLVKKIKSSCLLNKHLKTCSTCSFLIDGNEDLITQDHLHYSLAHMNSVQYEFGDGYNFMKNKNEVSGIDDNSLKDDDMCHGELEKLCQDQMKDSFSEKSSFMTSVKEFTCNFSVDKNIQDKSNISCGSNLQPKELYSLVHIDDLTIWDENISSEFSKRNSEDLQDNLGSNELYRSHVMELGTSLVNSCMCTCHDDYQSKYSILMKEKLYLERTIQYMQTSLKTVLQKSQNVLKILNNLCTLCSDKETEDSFNSEHERSGSEENSIEENSLNQEDLQISLLHNANSSEVKPDLEAKLRELQYRYESNKGKELEKHLNSLRTILKSNEYSCNIVDCVSSCKTQCEEDIRLFSGKLQLENNLQSSLSLQIGLLRKQCDIFKNSNARLHFDIKLKGEQLKMLEDKYHKSLQTNFKMTEYQKKLKNGILNLKQLSIALYDAISTCSSLENNSLGCFLQNNSVKNNYSSLPVESRESLCYNWQNGENILGIPQKMILLMSSNEELLNEKENLERETAEQKHLIDYLWNRVHEKDIEELKNSASNKIGFSSCLGQIGNSLPVSQVPNVNKRYCDLKEELIKKLQEKEALEYEVKQLQVKVSEYRQEQAKLEEHLSQQNHFELEMYKMKRILEEELIEILQKLQEHKVNLILDLKNSNMASS